MVYGCYCNCSSRFEPHPCTKQDSFSHLHIGDVVIEDPTCDSRPCNSDCIFTSFDKCQICWFIKFSLTLLFRNRGCLHLCWKMCPKLCFCISDTGNTFVVCQIANFHTFLIYGQSKEPLDCFVSLCDYSLLSGSSFCKDIVSLSGKEESCSFTYID